MLNDEISERIKAWMNCNISLLKEIDLSFNTDLNELALMDSLTFVEFLFFCQNEFSVKFNPIEITQENFQTIDNISGLIQLHKKQEIQ